MNINMTFKNLAQLRLMKEEICKEIDDIEKILKKHMQDLNIDVIIGTEHKVTFKEVISRRFNSSLFEKDNPELYEKYKQEVKTKRFTFK